jgi:hypothetical protein
MQIGYSYCLTLALLIGWFAIVGCSHTTAYLRDSPLGPRPSVNSGDIESRILLIGDAGAPRKDGEPVLGILRAWALETVGKSLMVFLGDNVYEHGLPPDNDDNRLARKEAQRRLDTLLDTVKQSQALALFVAGNHDWKAND